jgi:hypothetical protein
MEALLNVRRDTSASRANEKSEGERAGHISALDSFSAALPMRDGEPAFIEIDSNESTSEGSEDSEEDSEDESEDSDESEKGNEVENEEEDDDTQSKNHMPIRQPVPSKRTREERDGDQEGGSATKEVFKRPQKVTRYQAADGTTVMRAGVKPKIKRTQVQPSSLLDRLRTFMPEMAVANDQLIAEQQDGTISKRVMEVGDDEHEADYIELVRLHHS